MTRCAAALRRSCGLLLALTVTVSALENPGFETISTTGTISGWTVQRWNSNDPAQVASETTGAADGARAVSIAAVPKGGAGLASGLLPFDGLTSWRCRLRMKASVDYVGDAPWLFAAWYQGGVFVGNTALAMPVVVPTTWAQVEAVIPVDCAPSGADGMRLCLATRSAGTATASGRLWYDAVTLEPDAAVASVALACDHFAQWTSLGEPITFTLARGRLPPHCSRVQCRIFDSAGTLSAETSIDAATFTASGWTWRPSLPGFYELEFAAIVADGTAIPLVSSWSPRFPSGRVLALTRGRWAVAVAAAPTRPSAERSPLFGFTWDFTQPEACGRIGDLMGFSAVRLQEIPWGCAGTDLSKAIEPEPGVYHWEELDRRIDWMHAHGLKIIAQILGTPRWASPHPEDDQIYICMPGFAIWAPKDTAVWTRFLEQVVRRYQDRVAIWELWNEPHLPGGSCYWHDTPEHYVELLTSGYRTIKAIQPTAEVWNGGMGMRYLPFYRQLVRHGGGAAYDRLSLHGTGCDPAPFQTIDRTAGIAPRPWVNSEHHGILVNPVMSDELPSERTLARRLVLDAFGQLARGAGLICQFEMLDQIETEMLPAARQEGWFTHVSGLFRSQPRIEPRLPALVWHTIIAQVKPGMVIRSQHRIDGVRVVACDNGGMGLLLVWHDANTAQPLPTALTACCGEAIDWEGKPQAAGTPLAAGTMLLIRGADLARVAALPSGEALPALPGSVAQRAASVPHTTVLWGPLPDQPALTALPTYVEGATPEAVRAGFAIAATADGVDVVVEVTDAEHVAVDTPGKYWQGDSVQLGFDTLGAGIAGDQVQFQVALTSAGPVVWKDVAPYLGGDLPDRWTPAGHPARFAEAHITPVLGGMRYRIHIAASELHPLVIERDQPLHAALLVNSNRGKGRQGWVEWGSGIGKDFTPLNYGILEWAR
jgi:hypothetical protein